MSDAQGSDEAAAVAVDAGDTAVMPAAEIEAASAEDREDAERWDGMS